MSFKKIDNISSLKKLLLAVLHVAVLINLYACGGSVSEAENQPDPTEQPDDSPTLPSGPAVTGDELSQLPTVEVGARQFADANVLVTLNGIAEAAEGAEIARTLWVQTGGTPVEIADPTSTRTMIVIPDVVDSAQLEFRLIAEDSEGRVNSATTSVVVVPQPVFARVVGAVVNEADGEVVFRIRLNAPTTEQIIMLYRTVEGTALAESDFMPVEGTLIFEAGDQEQEVPVSVVDDSGAEESEIFGLQITHTSVGTAFSNSGVAVINDDDFLFGQIIQFQNAGPLDVLIDAVASNPIVEDPELAPGTGAITYSSNNETVAMVDANGTVVPVSAGSTIITATKAADLEYASATVSYNLTVSLLPQEIAFVSPTLTINTGETSRNGLDTSVASPGSGLVTYNSSNPLVATVDAQGFATGLSAGTATITATKAADNLYGEATASYELTVQGLLPLEVFFVQPDMTVGLQGFASNPLAESSLQESTGAVTYESSDPLIASVDGSGIVTAVQMGTATITATVESDGVYAASSAVYELTVLESNTPFLEAYIKAEFTDEGDQFGGSIGNRGMDFDSDVLVAGAASEDSLFQQEPVEEDNSATDSGAAYVYRRQSTGQWLRESFLKAPSGLPFDGFGHDVAVAGGVVAVGAPFANSEGAVYIYRFDTGSGTWAFSNQVLPPMAGVLGFGSSIVLNDVGDVLAVSAPSLDQTPLPSVYVYRFDGLSWAHEDTLLPPNSEADDGFGEALAMEGDTIVVGAPSEDSSLSGIFSTDDPDNNATDSGAVYIFERVDSTWNLNYYIKHPNNFSDIQMGLDVAIDGTHLAIADRSDAENGMGYRIYEQQNGVWTQGTQVIYSDSIAMDNNLMVTATLDGEVFINRLNQENLFTPINSIPAQIGNFAQTLAISGNIVTVAAPLDATGATGIGSFIPTDAAVPNSGAVHAYCIDVVTGCAQ